MSIEEGSINRVWIGGLYDPLGDAAREDVRRSTRAKRYRRYTPDLVTFISKGRYTCAMIELHHEIKGTVHGVGFSKCRPTDKYDPNIGNRVAMRRAIEDAVNA